LLNIHRFLLPVSTFFSRPSSPKAFACIHREEGISAYAVVLLEKNR